MDHERKGVKSMKSAVGAAVFGIAVVAVTGGVSAQNPLCPDSPQDCENDLERDVDVESVAIGPPPSVPSAQAPAGPIQVAGTQQLPVTGTEAGVLALAGVVLTAGGGALLWRSKAGSSAAG